MSQAGQSTTPSRKRGEYRKYLRDSTAPIPRSTLWSHRKSEFIVLNYTLQLYYTYMQVLQHLQLHHYHYQFQYLLLYRFLIPTIILSRIFNVRLILSHVALNQLLHLAPHQLIFHLQLSPIQVFLRALRHHLYFHLVTISTHPTLHVLLPPLLRHFLLLNHHHLFIQLICLLHHFLLPNHHHLFIQLMLLLHHCHLHLSVRSLTQMIHPHLQSIAICSSLSILELKFLFVLQSVQ